MKKFTLIIALIGLFVCYNKSYSQWDEITTPVNDNLNDMIYSTPYAGYIYAVGPNQTIIKSTDYGKNWEEIEFEGTNNFTSVFFFSETFGYVGGNSGDLYRTINGGFTYTERDGETEGNKVNDIKFKNTISGMLVGDNGIISYSTNGGLSWNKHTSPDFSVDINNVCMTSSTNAYAVGDNGLIIKSTDTGNNWTILQNATESYNLNAVAFKDDNYGIVIASNGNIYRTTDGGSIWSLVHTGTNSVLNSCVYSGNDRYFAVGNSGKILISNDNGATWQNQISPVSDNLNEIISISANIHVIAGDDGTVLQTTNAGGGATWALDVLKPNANSTFIAGRTATIEWNADNIDDIEIYYSTDNGSTFTYIKTVDASSGTTTWNVPQNIESDLCVIKINDSDNENLKALSNTFSIVKNNLEIVSPENGEFYKTGNILKIEWETNISSTFEIYYRLGIEDSWKLIEETDSENLEYDWTVPDEYSNECQIKIVDKNDGLNYAEMQGSCTIWDLEFTSPIAGDILITNRNHKITWNTNVNYLFDLYLINSNDEVVNQYTANGNKSFYDWSIGSIPEGMYRLKLEHKVYEQINAYSDEFFVEERILYIRSPIPEQIVNTYEDLLIKWNTDFDATFEIHYSTDNKNWQKITEVNSMVKEYLWTNLPDMNGDLYLRIWDKQDSLSVDYLNPPARFNNKLIELKTPNGNERINAGDVFNIKWEVDKISKINIKFSDDGGKNWIQDPGLLGIDAVIQNYYNWDIPLYPSDSCLIKIEDETDTIIYDESDEYFSILGLKLTTFNNGNTYLVGSEQEINWIDNGVEKVDIYWSTDNGSTWSLIEQEYKAEDKPYLWTIPNSPSDKNLIRIIDSDNSAYRDISDMNFITKGIKITNPKGGEVWAAGTTQEITWETYSSDNHVILEYSTDEGRNWITIDNWVDVTTKKYDWEVPKNNSEKCVIKISHVDDPAIYDISNEFFTIDGSGIVIITPEKDDVYKIGNKMSITWAEANVNTVDIYYSDDNKNNWHPIISDVNSDHYDWVIPNTVNPSTECYMKIEDSDNSEVLDISEMFRIGKSGGAYDVPDRWTFDNSTGTSAIIILSTSVANNIDGTTIDKNDAIGFFYEDNGDYICAGYGKWNPGNNLSVTVWGDNPITPDKDGFEVNEEYILKFWDGEKGEEMMLDATYAESTDSYFFDNNISILTGLSVYTELRINLTGGVWSMISSNKVPAESGMEVLMNKVDASFGEYGFMKDEDGQVYFPYEDINTIGNWNMSNGYQIYVEEDTVLSIMGIRANVASYKKALEANKWHIVSYLPQSSMGVSTAFNHLGDTLILVKNDDGQVYYPDYGINQIGTVFPGEGYKLCVDRNSILRYPAAAVPGIPKVSDGEIVNFIYETPDIKSGNNSTYVFESNQLSEGDEIAVYDNSNKLIGAGVYQKGRAVLTVWGDNSVTDNNKEGAGYNERLFVKVFDKKENIEYDAEILNITNIISETEHNDLRYAEDDVLKININKGNISSVPKAGEITANHYPNPVTDYITIDLKSKEIIKNVEIYDVSGNKIYFESVNAGMVVIDAKDYPAGSYFYRITTDDGVTYDKFNVVR